MATFSSNHPELLETRLRLVYFKEFAMEPMMFTRVFNMERSSKAHEDTLEVSPLGTLVQKPEGTPISYDDPVSGTRKRVTHTTYALGFRVTMEMMDDDQYNIINRMPRDLADATRDHQENLAWGVLNDAFAGATHTGLDGLSLCNAAHPMLKSGTTQSNVLTPGVALSQTGIEALLTRARLTQDHAGRQTPMKPQWLIIHPNDDHEAHRLLDSQFEPNTTENQVNAIRSSRTGIMPMSVPYLTDTDNWFLVAPKNRHTLIWYRRKPVAFDRSKDPQTKDMLFDVMYRASVTFDQWFGVWGSAP